MGRAILSNLNEGVAISNSVKRSSEKTEVATYGGRRRVEVVGMWSEPRRGRWLAERGGMRAFWVAVPIVIL